MEKNYGCSTLRYYPKPERSATKEEIERWGRDDEDTIGLRTKEHFSTFVPVDDFLEMYASEDGGHTLISLWFPLEMPFGMRALSGKERKLPNCNVIELFFYKRDVE